MELFNQIFYASFGVIVLVIFLGTLNHRELKLQNRVYFYWPTALLLMFFANFGFLAAGIEPAFFLSLGNTSLVFSSFAIILFIRSWDSHNSYVNPRNFWIAYILFLIAYEFLKLYTSFHTRVYFMTSLLGISSLLGLVEVYLIPKKEHASQFWVLKLAFLLHLLLVIVRAVNLTYTLVDGVLVQTIYQEGAVTSMLRALGIVSNLLIYLAISNILLEKVWQKEIKKSANTEIKMLSTLNALALARDKETGSHILRTEAYVRRLAFRLREQGNYLEQLSDQAIKKIVSAAPLHDLGKVGIPDYILYKEGPLTKEEWGIMKTHALIGETVLTSTQSQLPNEDDGDDVIQVAIQIAGSHHEQWDGGGYPRSLKGEAIPLPARIMALADMYDALTSERVYKDEWSHDQAVSEILSKKRSYFDPLVVDAFILEQDQFKKIAQQYKDDASAKKTFHYGGQVVEQKLHHSDGWFEPLFRYAPIGMAMMDHVTGTFLEVNDALLTYTQYTKEELLKLSYWDITPPEYVDQEARQTEELNRTGSFAPNYKEYIRKDGSRLPISIRGFSLTGVDGRKLVWGIIDDLSAQTSITGLAE